jgi:hypothetical protein
MEDDLKEGGYRFIYGITFIVVFCVIPFIYIMVNSDINRKQIQYSCTDPIEVTEALPENNRPSIEKYRYKLKDGTTYSSTLRYKVGDLVCKY